MRGLMGCGCRMWGFFCCLCLVVPVVLDCQKESMNANASSSPSSKIFPPTPSDLPSTENPSTVEGEEGKEEASTVNTDIAGEPQTKKVKTSAEELDKDEWETIEKPSETGTDVSEEGVEVEAEAVVGGSEVGKTVGDAGEGKEVAVAEREEEMKAGGLQPGNMLARDW